MYVLALSDYKQHAAAAGYKPAPPIRQTNCCLQKSPASDCGAFIMYGKTICVLRCSKVLLNDYLLTILNVNASGQLARDANTTKRVNRVGLLRVDSYVVNARVSTNIVSECNGR